MRMYTDKSGRLWFAVVNETEAVLYYSAWALTQHHYFRKAVDRIYVDLVMLAVEFDLIHKKK